MRKALVFAAILLLLVTLACNLPRLTGTPGQENPLGRTGPFAKKTATATFQPACTPPACKPDEIYYCPGDCPGGCGTTCATPTGSPPTVTPLPPTFTPFPMCTPPACRPDEVYYCPGDCPGGCGTTCATPTPVPGSSVPTIISFTADRTTITEGETLKVTWAAVGGQEAAITWLGGGGVMDGIGNLAPDSGTVDIAPKGNPVTLRVSNAEGFTEATLNLTIACAHAWVPELAASMGDNCPFEAEVGWAAQQPFQNGFMVWLEPSQLIYVFFTNYGGQSYRSYADTFKEGDPESDPSLIPPAGFLQPVRGFGKVWRENPEVRDNLGWATAPETGFDTWRQSYQGFGMHNITIWMKDINHTIYRLNPMGSIWEVYVP